MFAGAPQRVFPTVDSVRRCAHGEMLSQNDTNQSYFVLWDCCPCSWRSARRFTPSLAPAFVREYRWLATGNACNAGSRALFPPPLRFGGFRARLAPDGKRALGVFPNAALKDVQLDGQILFRVLAKRGQQGAALHQHVVGIVVKRRVLQQLARRALSGLQFSGDRREIRH